MTHPHDSPFGGAFGVGRARVRHAFSMKLARIVGYASMASQVVILGSFAVGLGHAGAGHNDGYMIEG